MESLWVLTLLLSGHICFSIFFKSKHVQNIISKKSTRAYKHHATSRFINDLCTINDDDQFSKSFKCIYSGELELKLEHSGTHATFLDLDLRSGIFVYKLFDKRSKFSFFIIRMAQLESNIPSTIFYGFIFSEFFRIAQSTLKLEHVLPRVVSINTFKNYNELLQELKNYLFSKSSRSNQYFLFIRYVMKNFLISNNHCQKKLCIVTFVRNI